MADALRTRVGGLPGRVPADHAIGPRDGGPRRPQPTRTKCIVWSSRNQAIPGGLQRQIDRLAAEADTLRLNVSVVSPPDGGPGPGDRLRVAHYRTSLEAIVSQQGTAAILYCARLYKGLERAQLPALMRIAEQVPAVIRCPTTDDARRLRSAALAAATANPHGQPVIVHCLNRRSAELLRGLRALGLRPIVQCNTARPRPRGEVAVAFPPTAPSVFYCGRADPSKNVEGLLEAWSLVPTDRCLNLFGPQQLQRLASREHRVVYGGCYQGDPPFRLGDVVVLPSFREGHANVLVEAFRAGAVVVGSAVSGVGEHLADHRGILIGRPLNARSIATAIASAVRLPADQRSRLGLRAQAYFDGTFASPYSSAIHVLNGVLGRLAPSP